MHRGSSRNPSSRGSSRISFTPNLMTQSLRRRSVETEVQVPGADPLVALDEAVGARGVLGESMASA